MIAQWSDYPAQVLHHLRMSPRLPVAHVQMFNGSVRTGDLHVSVQYNAPRVELFSVVHDDGCRLLHHREHHDGAQRSSRR